MNKFRNENTYVRFPGTSGSSGSDVTGGGVVPESVFRGGGSTHGFTSRGSNTSGDNSGDSNGLPPLLHPSLNRGFSTSLQYYYLDENTGKTHRCTVNPIPLSTNQIEISYEVQCSCNGTHIRNLDGTPVSATLVKKGDNLRYREQDVIVIDLDRGVESYTNEMGQSCQDRDIYIKCTRLISPASDGTFPQLTPMSPRGEPK